MTKHAAAITVALALAAPAAAQAGFQERVHVLWSQHATTGNGDFGWAVSELGDADGDRRSDVIVGQPFTGGGITWVYSGATGEQIYRLDGEAGDAQGYAIADAGDTDRDGYDDIISGAPQTGTRPGRAYLYSGRTGELLYTFTAAVDGDSFGAAVSSAGDIDRDGRADLLIGAPTDGIGGSAYVYSGRTHALIRKLEGLASAGDMFANGTGWTPDVDGDKVSDLVIGAGDAGPTQGGAGYVFSGATGTKLFDLAPSPAARQFGTFFVAGVGDVNRDHVPDVYGADYAAADLGAGTGYAAVYSGVDGSLIHSWTGSGAGQGLGPGRGAGDVDGDHRADLAIGSWRSSDGAPGAGKIELFSGATGERLRTITSTTAGENFGFDTVGIGDVNHDRVPDLVAAAASGDSVYVIAGEDD